MPNKSRWLSLIQYIAPVVLATINPALAPLGGLIVHGISEAEDLQGASGAEKLAHVVNLAQLGAEGMNAAAGKVLVDPAIVSSTAAQVISATVDVTNLIHGLPAAALRPAPAPVPVPAPVDPTSPADAVATE